MYVYYNGGIENVSGRNLTKDKYNLGLKYQCVEFVKRYYYEYFKHKMPETYGHAKDFFKRDLKDGELNADRDLIQYNNPGISKPEPNDILVFRGTSFNPFGHVAIISKATEKELEIIQQNPGPYAKTRAKFKLHQSDNHWKIENDRILGWLRKYR